MERMRKTELRNKIARLRLGISPGEKREWDEKLCREFLQQLEQSATQPGQMIYLYLDVRNEAGTRQILGALAQGDPDRSSQGFPKGTGIL